MKIPEAQPRLPNDTNNFNQKLLIALAAVALLFFTLVIYFQNSNALSQSSRIAFILVAATLSLGLFCYWQLFKISDEEKKTRLLIKLGGRKIISEVEQLQIDLDKRKDCVFEIEAKIQSEIEKGEVLLSIPASTLQSLELVKRIISLLDRRLDVISYHLEEPTLSTVATAGEIMHKDLNLQHQASDSLVIESDYPSIPFAQYQGTLDSLISHIEQQIHYKQAA